MELMMTDVILWFVAQFNKEIRVLDFKTPDQLSSVISHVGLLSVSSAVTSLCLPLAQDGLLVQINSTVGEERGLDVSLLFHLPPRYPSCPPDISVSSTGLSKTQCHSIRQKLLDHAAALPPEPMVHQLVEWLQVNTMQVRGGALRHLSLALMKRKQPQHYQGAQIKTIRKHKESRICGGPHILIINDVPTVYCVNNGRVWRWQTAAGDGRRRWKREKKRRTGPPCCR